MSDDPRYPIGKFNSPTTVSDSDRKTYIDEIESAPAQLRAAIARLTAAQLSTPYREGGWTVRQLVHHVPDSHMTVSYTHLDVYKRQEGWCARRRLLGFDVRHAS